jgi:ubiquinone/menaquinone biosynthesis C-methylase UbiE
VSDATVFAFSNATVADAYERYFVPRIFRPWAGVLLDALDVRAGESLLDIACGPGTVAKEAALRIGDGGVVIGTDVSAEMLDVARSSTPAAARVRYEEASSEALPFPHGSFDAVTVQQGMQFFSNRTTAIAEMYRVLRAGGRAGISVWASIEDAPFFAVVREVVANAVPAVSEMLERPLVDGITLRDELASAGFKVSVETVSLPLEFEGGIEQAIEAMRGAPMWPTVADQPAPVRRAILDAARERFGRHLHYGRVRMTMRANVALAHKTR